jgi:hypothetical protein
MLSICYSTPAIYDVLEHKMTIYQVINEQNHLLYAFMNLQSATQEADMLNEASEDHYYYVNALEIEF